jgi:pilus assembly protein CpaB
MKIKWSVIVLVFLGIAAALCAALLTASIRAQDVRDKIVTLSPDVTILVSTQDVPGMSIVKADTVMEKTVSRGSAPEGCFSEPAQIIGKMVSVPMIEGQAFTQSNFPSEGSGAYLASVLPKGSRAVCISLNDYSGLEGLLYPGCVVDVLATFKVSSTFKLGEAVSTTLLENIGVLAVENQTVASQSESEDAPQRARAPGKDLLVALMVDSKQAEALQLAMEHGNISLALRNPNDSEKIDRDATLLSQGRLAQLAELLDPSVSMAEAAEVAEATSSIPQAFRMPSGKIVEEVTHETFVEPKPEPEPEPKPEPEPIPTIDVDVIRGVFSETISFPFPTS